MDISTAQRDLLRQLEANQENFSSAWDETRGILSFARSDNLVRDLPGAVNVETNREATLRLFLGRYEALFGPANLMRSLRLLRDRTDQLGFWHYEYQQTWTPRRGARHAARAG